MQIMKKGIYLTAVDVGGTKVRLSIADKNGFLGKYTQDVRLEGFNTAIPGQIMEMHEHATREFGVESDKISVSTCSPFKKMGGGFEGYKVVVAPNLCGGLADRSYKLPNKWEFIPLEKSLKFSGKFRQVEIGNDCVTGVVAEYKFGAGKGFDYCTYITWSTGIGTGSITEGKLMSGGKNGNAPHGGHIIIAEEGPQCGCGNYGDLEAMCSGKAIARAFGLGPPYDTKVVFKAYRDGDPEAIKIVERAARNFGRGLASINTMLDTEVMIIGGSVWKDRDILGPLVKNEFYKSFPAFSEGTMIVDSALGDYLGDMAALSMIMPEAWEEKWLREKPWENAPEPVELK